MYESVYQNDTVNTSIVLSTTVEAGFEVYCVPLSRRDAVSSRAVSSWYLDPGVDGYGRDSSVKKEGT